MDNSAVQIKVFSQIQLCDLLGLDNDFDTYLKNYRDTQNRIKYFNLDGGIWQPTDQIFVTALIGNKIVGILLYVIVDKPISWGHKHYLSYCSVDPKYWGQKIAKSLIQYWADYVVKIELGECGCSGYTEMGYNYLNPILQNLPFAVQPRQIEF